MYSGKEDIDPAPSDKPFPYSGEAASWLMSDYRRWYKKAGPVLASFFCEKIILTSPLEALIKTADRFCDSSAIGGVQSADLGCRFYFSTGFDNSSLSPPEETNDGFRPAYRAGS